MDKAQPDLAILNTQVNPFEWTVPKIIGEIPSLRSHTANLVNNYMIVAFGKYNYLKFCFIIFNINIFNSNFDKFKNYRARCPIRNHINGFKPKYIYNGYKKLYVG